MFFSVGTWAIVTFHCRIWGESLAKESATSRLRSKLAEYDFNEVRKSQVEGAKVEGDGINKKEGTRKNKIYDFAQ